MMMNNESEFIFDEILTEGFTVVPNTLLTDNRLTDGAIGLYCRIIRYKNIPNWKIYQSTLINENNKETKIRNAMNLLIKAGWIKKIQLRNKKGHICGVKYLVFSRSQSPDITNSIPKRENPVLDNPVSEKLVLENQVLINKDNKKERLNKTSSSKSQDLFNLYQEAFDKKISAYMKNKINSYIEKTNIDFIIEVLKYCIDHNAETASYLFKTLDNLISKNIVTIEDLEISLTKHNIELESKKKSKKIKKNVESTKKTLKFDNFESRNYDYDSLEKQLLGWS